MQPIEFLNTTKLLFGPGMIEKIGAEAKAIGQKALLVTGKGSVERTGVLTRVVALLEEAGVSVTHLNGVDPNPRITSVREGVKLCRENDIDLVIALGGGSVMDCSKVIAAGVPMEADPWEMINHGQAEPAIPTSSLPTIMAPTLAATGSDMNANAVITNVEAKQKSYVAGHACMYPVVAVVDPELTLTVPPIHTAYGAIDTISHVFEAYFNGADDAPLTDRMQEAVMLTVLEQAPVALSHPDDLSARTNLQWASIVALNGWAHVGSKGPFVCHQMEHVLSAYTDIAHAAGLAILMPAWLKCNHGERLDRAVQFAERLFGIDPTDRDPKSVARDGIACFEEFLKELGVATRLSELDIGPENFDAMATDTITISGDATGCVPGRPPLDKAAVLRVFEAAK
jgi:alcohol dehydrogenase